MDKFQRLYEEYKVQYTSQQIDEAAIRLPKHDKLIKLFILKSIFPKIKSTKDTSTLYNKGENFNNPDVHAKLKQDIEKVIAKNDLSDIRKQFNKKYNMSFPLTEPEFKKYLQKISSMDSVALYKYITAIKRHLKGMWSLEKAINLL